MKINLRGGGDIASNPARLRSRNITCLEYFFTDMVPHGAGTPDSRLESPATGQDDSRYGFRSQKPATGLAGTLDEAFGSDEWRKLTQTNPRASAHE